LATSDPVLPVQLQPDREPALIQIVGRGWLEKKRTGGRARYWYQRWRERQPDGKIIKRSEYQAPVRENETIASSH
jgi:hypothetical protein